MFLGKYTQYFLIYWQLNRALVFRRRENTINYFIGGDLVHIGHLCISL